MNNIHPFLKESQKKWNLRLWVLMVASSLLLGLGASVFTYLQFQNWWGAFAAIPAFLLLWAVFRSDFPSLQQVAALLNQQFPELEYSADLLLLEAANGLQKLQKAKAAKQLESLISKNPVWYPLPIRTFYTASATSFLIALVGFVPLKERQSSLPGQQVQEVVLATPEEEITAFDSLKMTGVKIGIQPPAYTGITSSSQPTPDIMAPEGSVIEWSYTFNRLPQTAWLAFANGDSIPLKANGQELTARLKRKENGFYRQVATDEKGNRIYSPYHRIQFTEDKAPAVAISGVPQFQRQPFDPKASWKFSMEVSDDYGLTDAYLIATITKGQGESVKFREEKIPVKTAVKGKNFSSDFHLKAADFDMEPGNELYFYAVGVDNRQPAPQISKTETYFFVLEDTTEVEFSLAGGLGVDIMPDYFRSQLQIIMDSEKLLEEKSRIPKEEFNNRSNNLAHDQKSLRLKYGQFIGMEEDSGIATSVAMEDNETVKQPDPNGNVLQEYGHDHDHENEEGQLLDKGTYAQEEHHDHDHEDKPEGAENSLLAQQQELLEGFMHNHEDEETATFFYQSLKSKLHAALNEMWDAELHLRLYHPEESLPYQRKALKYINEIKNHARIYVQRIGFDPPPIKEAEKRLTGKLKETNDHPFREKVESEDDFQAIRAALPAIEKALQNQETNNALATELEGAGSELARLAFDFVGEKQLSCLKALTTLRTLTEKAQFGKAEWKQLSELKAILFSVLPEGRASIERSSFPADSLTNAFRNALTAPALP